MDGIEALMYAIGYTKSKIGALGDVTEWLGVTTTAISDGSTTNPIIIDGESVTAEAGDFVQYGSTIFAFNKDGKWQTASLSVVLENGCLYFN